MTRLHPCLLFIGTCLALLITYYAPGIFLGEHFFASDHQLYFEPLTRFIGKSYSEFRLPLWNPYVHCGMPQAATPSPGVFYPPNGIFAFLSFGPALAWLMVFHQLLAGLGSYLFICSLGWGAPAAFAAGIIAAFCGYMMSLTVNHTLVFTASWLPISFLALRSIRFCQSPRKLYLFVTLASITTFLVVAAGRPEVGAPALALLGLFTILQSFKKAQAQATGNNNFGWQCLALCTAALMSMAVVMPSVEWFFYSPRSHGMDTSYVFLWSANWYDLLAMIFAQPLGDLTQIGAPYLNVAASRPGYVPYLPSALVGPVAFTLAIWGVSDRSWRGRNWTLFLFLASLIMVAGQNLDFVPKLFAVIPFATIFRYPIKLIILPIFCIAVWAARGMWCLLAKKLSVRVLAIAAGLWTLGLLMGTALSFAGVLAKAVPLGILTGMSGAQLLIGQAVLRGSLLGWLVCLIAFLFIKNHLSARLTSSALITLLIGSLFAPAFYYRAPTINKGYFTNTPYLITCLNKLKQPTEDVHHQRLLILYFDPLKPPSKGFPGQPNQPTANYYQYYHDLLLPNTNIDWLQPETFGYEGAETKDYRGLFSNALHRAIPDTRPKGEERTSLDDLPLWQFCRASATVWVCTQIQSYVGPVPKCEARYFALLSEDPSMNLRIYRVKKPLARAFICKNWRWENAHENVLEAIRQPEDSNFDPEEALVEPLVGDGPSYSTLMPPKNIGASGQKTKENDSAQEPVLTQEGMFYPAKSVPRVVERNEPPVFLKDSPEHVSISTSLVAPAFLVLADQYYPGWIAHIDSVEAPVYRANGVFRAIYVPKGGHLIQFDYQPQSVSLGLGLAALGATIVACLLWAAAWPSMWRWLKLMSGEGEQP